MAINFNDLNQGRVGILGLHDVITQSSNAPLQTAFSLNPLNLLPGFGKSDEQKALEQIQGLREDQRKITAPAGGDPNLLKQTNEFQYNKYQEIEKQIEDLKKQFPSDTAVQEASLTNRFGFPLTASLDTSGGAQAIEKAKAREELDNRKFMSGFTNRTTTDPMDIREQNRLGNLAANELFMSKPAVTFDAPYMSTGLKMVPKPTFGQRLSSGINQLKTGFGKVKSDIGDFISSCGTIGAIAGGIGSLLNALFDT